MGCLSLKLQWIIQQLSCVLEKMSESELKIILSTHKEKRENSGLPANTRRNGVKIKCLKVGQIKEIDDTQRKRTIEIKDNEEKDLKKNRKQMLNEHELEHAKYKKDSAKLTQNVNLSRKFKGEMLPCELWGENGRQLSNCGRVVEKWSSIAWKRGTIASKNL